MTYMDDPASLAVELEALREEIERHARVDYWAERYRDLESETRRQRVRDLEMIAQLMIERDQARARVTELEKLLECK